MNWMTIQEAISRNCEIIMCFKDGSHLMGDINYFDNLPDDIKHKISHRHWRSVFASVRGVPIYLERGYITFFCKRYSEF